MEAIIGQLIDNFNFALMVVVNFITYLVIKVIDDLNGTKVPTTWQKRIVFIIVSIFVGVWYNYTTSIPTEIIINSCVAAPLAWSWLAKPIAKALGIDYKKGINKK